LAYVKTVWSTGDTITATLTNHLETQYDESKVDLDAHKADTANPHGVTTTQIGAETPTGAQTKANTAEENAISWAKSFGLGTLAKDVSGTDLNVLNDTGFYRGNKNLTGSNNFPPVKDGQHYWFYIIQVQHSSLWSVQHAIDFNNVGYWTRYSYDSAGARVWGAWKEQAYKDEVVQITNNTSLNTDSRNSRGVTRLYRSDGDNDYSLQHKYGLIFTGGNAWQLKGYAGDTFHAEAHVAFATKADTVDGIHFRISNGALQYDDGSGWKNVGFDPTDYTYTRLQRGVTSDAGNTYTLVNVTGKGILTNAVVSASTYTNTYRIVITIDGIQYFSNLISNGYWVGIGTASFPRTALINQITRDFIIADKNSGVGAPTEIGYAPIPFNTSCKVELIYSSGSYTQRFDYSVEVGVK
jgi:hypothetical protein